MASRRCGCARPAPLRLRARDRGDRRRDPRARGRWRGRRPPPHRRGEVPRARRRDGVRGPGVARRERGGSRARPRADVRARGGRLHARRREARGLRAGLRRAPRGGRRAPPEPGRDADPVSAGGLDRPLLRPRRREPDPLGHDRDRGARVGARARSPGRGRGPQPAPRRLRGQPAREPPGGLRAEIDLDRPDPRGRHRDPLPRRRAERRRGGRRAGRRRHLRDRGRRRRRPRARGAEGGLGRPRGGPPARGRGRERRLALGRRPPRRVRHRFVWNSSRDLDRLRLEGRVVASAVPVSFRVSVRDPATGREARSTIEAARSVLGDGARGTSSAGSWRRSAGRNPYGTGSLYLRHAEGSYTYDVRLPRPGAYEVFAWWTQYPSRAESVPYAISTAEGETIVTVDQRVRGGQWNRLGAFRFGEAARIQIRARKDGFSYCADAVLLRPAR
ncbi:MAG: golvesin C-terminal-like domain-containing protein [Planctomycetota bacterium]